MVGRYSVNNFFPWFSTSIREDVFSWPSHLFFNRFLSSFQTGLLILKSIVVKFFLLSVVHSLNRSIFSSKMPPCVIFLFFLMSPGIRFQTVSLTDFVATRHFLLKKVKSAGGCVIRTLRLFLSRHSSGSSGPALECSIFSIAGNASLRNKTHKLSVP